MGFVLPRNSLRGLWNHKPRRILPSSFSVIKIFMVVFFFFFPPQLNTSGIFSRTDLLYSGSMWLDVSIVLFSKKTHNHWPASRWDLANCVFDWAFHRGFFWPEKLNFIEKDPKNYKEERVDSPGSCFRASWAQPCCCRPLHPRLPRC